jgi:hypothetical protein
MLQQAVYAVSTDLLLLKPQYEYLIKAETGCHLIKFRTSHDFP